ncbi:hypothetical protein Pla52o_07870 [Novipirellula galeiformis]|uniref:Uncharacterized protein n=1 Tax=Novipirellula galeiformis TaxID=2528004 RepID=A0A5C6CU58_9BACT|nr:hypothetical protein Pla52o_07870 [Novipirellula galeiformis]
MQYAWFGKQDFPWLSCRILRGFESGGCIATRLIRIPVSVLEKDASEGASAAALTCHAQKLYRSGFRNQIPFGDGEPQGGLPHGPKTGVKLGVSQSAQAVGRQSPRRFVAQTSLKQNARRGMKVTLVRA